MSGPGGSVTKRDDRRDARRKQFQERQRQRQLERQRKIRRQRMIRGAIIGGSVLIVALLAFFVIHGASSGGSGGNNANTPAVVHGTGTYANNPATGETRDGMQCYATEQTQQHIHAYLAIYANGQPVTVPAGTGIPQSANCIYPLHVHDGEENIIHIEAPNTDTYTLGAFFDIWGEALSANQVMDYKADASHPLVFEVFDANGKMTKVTSNPLDIALKEHETVVVLYNSPNVTPQPYANWSQFGL
ncbi:MAG: hypothetical protein OJF49_001198 [Ktedonobacterales bacterium]|nr:MAG: hypothetical protein OJF49_001198 [Ktedonobacterales bacterium]